MISLEAINLPADLDWQDEFDWTPIAQSSERTLNGKLAIEEAVKQHGRPMTLVGGQNAAWVDRSTVETLTALLTLNKQMTLSFFGLEYPVVWRHSDTPIEAKPVMRIRNPQSTHQYTLTLRFTIVGDATPIVEPEQPEP